MEVQRTRAPGRHRRLATLAALALVATIPAAAMAKPAPSGYQTSSPAYVALQPGIAGTVVPLINSGEEIFSNIFEGIPDGIGVVPFKNKGYVDMYVAHEQSHVPFGLSATSVFADYQDSSVSRVRVDIATQSITDLAVPLSPRLGFLRFCSATIVGPDQGFPHYTFLVNEESNDVVPVPAGAPYGSDAAAPAGQRQGGYSAYLDTRTGKVGVLAGAGRMNHENTVVVPGWKKGIYALTGDDTFTFPSTPARPNLSQLYMYGAKNAAHFLKDDGQLWAFRVTADSNGPVEEKNPKNGANDFFEITTGDDWQGEFIPVPAEYAAGTTGDLPQDALEDWSNANNVFQFIRIEDIAYDPDQPRTVYFTDTGNSRLIEDAGTGRLYRASSGTPGTSSSLGRVFKLVMNAADPTVVDSFSILTEASAIGMRNPDNLAVGHDSIMVQEDTSNAKVWQYSLGADTWTHVATATQPEAETSGIVDVSDWFGAGWWALDVQSHVSQSMDEEYLTWDGPTPPGGDQYRLRREAGQLLLMQVAGS